LSRTSNDELLVNPESGSELAGELEGYRSLKAKRYRIVYRRNDAEMTVEGLLVVLGAMSMIRCGLSSSTVNNKASIKSSLTGLLFSERRQLLLGSWIRSQLVPDLVFVFEICSHRQTLRPAPSCERLIFDNLLCQIVDDNRSLKVDNCRFSAIFFFDEVLPFLGIETLGILS
jgi:hypothetical protein